MSRKRPKVCPKHGVKLTGHQTRYGYRYECTVKGCTVACWSGDTSTPADDETRRARIAAHNAFDSLWKEGPFRRSELYRKLSEHLGLSRSKTHIGMFDAETCKKVVEFAGTLEVRSGMEVNS